jgi:hypothetical protein
MTTNLRLQLATLADALVNEGRKKEAKQVLDLTMEKMPERNVPFDRIMLPVIEGYYDVGDTATANAITERLFGIMDENMTHFLSLEPRFVEKVASEMEMTHMVLERMVQATSILHKQKALGDRLTARLKEIDALYETKLEDAEMHSRRDSKVRF